MEIILLFVSVVLIPMIIFREIEKRQYNNGVCKSCGSRLRHFDNDSQGGRGYCCDNCDAVNIWISYPWIDHKHNERIKT